MPMPRRPQERYSAPQWMITFGDMNTLLLCFFVFLVTVMTLDVRKFNLVLSAFQSAVGVLEEGKSINLTQEELLNMGQRPEKLGAGQEIVQPQAGVDRVMGWLEQNIVQGGRNEVQVEVNERGLKIMLTDKALFERGSDQLRPEADELVGKLVFFLNNIVPSDEFRIEGHTDDVALEGLNLFRSNLDLSAARAARIYERLARDGVSKARMSIAGYGEMRPLERRDGEDIETWRARNRRVEIAVIWKENENG